MNKLSEIVSWTGRRDPVSGTRKTTYTVGKERFSDIEDARKAKDVPIWTYTQTNLYQTYLKVQFQSCKQFYQNYKKNKRDGDNKKTHLINVKPALRDQQ